MRHQHIDQLHKTEKRWFAVYTYFRREKSALQELLNKDIEAFVPLIHRSKRYARKLKHYRVPLISHYVFVHICQHEYIRVLQTRDVIKFIKFSKDLIAIPPIEIDILKHITGISHNAEINIIHPGQIGEEVEIISGNLVGLRATLVQIKNNDQFVIALKNIGYSLKIQLKKEQLRKVSNAIIA